MSRSLKAHILLIAVTFVWGSTFVLIKAALADVTPLLFNAVRMTLAGLALGLVYWKALRKMNRAEFIDGMLVALMMYFGYEFQTSGLKLTTPSKSALLTGMSVVLVPLILHFGWRKHVSKWTIFGVLIACVGLFLLTVPAGTSRGFSLTEMNLGDLLSMGCAVCFAFQIILVGRASERHGFEPIAFLQVAGAAVLMFATVPIAEHAHVTWSSTVIWAILVTGLLGTAAAFTVQAWAQQFMPATNTALIFLLEPVFAWATSFVILHERLNSRSSLGAVLILVGVVLSELLGSQDHPSEEIRVS
ncbi:Putative 10 TMS drug/metabolite exporter, DME family, DMT superfamily [Candidatus Koribacter versatilis Ellin345]|uniref:10 TMS drug/metabolite exporter, DME family, DMT superfamily n=1 Tax=Koribacter versatilis (strain Ellin345) TaxID=204669 RepID=Q1IRR2_KORVE|nr:DMT family transporter [Candidatus Koribacter versatilis]ABF40438.1 Putative 10 TMS drug/metabolite exporter, DME family, DMT superfamily [Candidatus Koribacter versatilis Ellin345]